MDLETLEEQLSEILDCKFKIETDSRGRVVIYTGLIENEDGELEELKSDDEEDEDSDPDFDPDFEQLAEESDED